LTSKVAVALLLLANAAPVLGQSGPEDVVRAFFKAEDEGRWLDAARMLDLRRFESLRQSAVAGFRRRPAARRVSAAEIMRMQPDIPRSVAEYQAKQANKSIDKYNPLEDQFANVSSVDSLAALSTQDAAARWLEAAGSGWKNSIAYKRSQDEPPMDCPELPDSVRRSMFTHVFKEVPSRILGTAAPSDSTRYVIIAEQFTDTRDSANVPSDADTPNSPRVLTLRNEDGAWKIIPRYDMPQASGMFGGVSVMISCKRDSVTKRQGRK
jgi:hypothetical protein